MIQADVTHTYFDNSVGYHFMAWAILLTPILRGRTIVGSLTKKGGLPFCAETSRGLKPKHPSPGKSNLRKSAYDGIVV